MIYQVMEAMDIGDAVSSIARRNAALLAELGQPAAVLAQYAHPDIGHETRPCHEALATPDCGLIFHYWGQNSSTWMLQVLRGRKAVHYHNITPPHFFPRDSDLFRSTTAGYAQLRQIADAFDLILGDSEYNVEEFCRYTTRPKPTLHLYPVVDQTTIRTAPPDRALLETLERGEDVHVVFVGRVARNKRHDRVMRVFDYYYRKIGREAQLWLVGNDRVEPEYRAELERLRGTLPSRERIHFTGKLSDAEVMAYLQAADVFVCPSEHEGFCMPIAQAMALDVPVIAYAAAAVPETMGGSGLLVHEWDAPRIAELMYLTLTDTTLRTRVLASQRANLQRFSEAEARRRLAAVLAYLQTGETSPLFVYRRPG